MLQEKEEQEKGLRRQVAELQEMVQEQVHGKQSLAASLEAARKEVEAVFGREAGLEAEVAEATQTAQLRLEKTRVVELKLEELTNVKEKLVVELERPSLWAPPRSQIMKYPPIQCRGYYSETIFIFLGGYLGCPAEQLGRAGGGGGEAGRPPGAHGR